MILADSSIWIDHFRRVNPTLESLIASGRILMHPFVVAEVALGSLAQRRTKLALMDLLVQVRTADISEVRRMIDAQPLYSRGIGLVDAHLIASCLITPGVSLWTRDERLAAAAQFAGVEATHHSSQ